MFTHSKTNSDKSSHHATRPFFGKGADNKQSGFFYTQTSVLPAIQKKCAACEEEEQIQTKLTIGQPDDQYEREADAIADRVVNNSEADIQRQQESEEEEEEPIQTKAKSTSQATASPNIATAIKSTHGSGQALTGSTRHFFESSFGRDFGDVKIHTDSRANHLARSINARAFTHKSDVYFNSGEYQPHSSKGQRLLAHELTHVVQQTGTGALGLQRQVKKVRQRVEFLRQISVPSSGVDGIPDSAIKSTREFSSFMDSRNIWQWKDKVVEAEALLACRLIIADLHVGLRVNWPNQARFYMNIARNRLNARQPGQPAQPVSTPSKKRGDAPTKTPTAPTIAPKDTKCGKLEDGSIVFKGTGEIPKSLRMFGEEWELRFIQRGACCRTYIFRLKVGSGPKWQGRGSKLIPLSADSKLRGDLRRTDNICTNKTRYGGRISWEGKLTLFRMSKLKRALGKRGLSGGGFEVVIKPQIGVNISAPVNKSNMMRLTGFIKVRVGAELSVGNNVIVEVRWHGFECDFGWLEIGYKDIHSWNADIDQCLAALRDYITKNAIPKIKLPSLPGFQRPWYQQPNMIPTDRIF